MIRILKWGGLAIIAFLVIRFILNTIFSIGTWAFQTVIMIFTSSTIGVVLLFALFAMVSYIFYLKKKADQNYTHILLRAKRKNNDKQALAAQQTLPAPAKDLTDFMQQLAPKELAALIRQYYKNDTIGFGEVGATEFIGSILLAEYKPNLQEVIQMGHSKVFQQHWSPLQFSDFMDGIVQSSEVPYREWGKMCRLLYTVHPHLKNHPCSKSPKVI